MKKFQFGMASLIQAHRILKTGGDQNNLSVLIQPPTPKMGKRKQVLSQEELKYKSSMCYGDAAKKPKHKKNKKIKLDKVTTKGLKKKQSGNLIILLVQIKI